MAPVYDLYASRETGTIAAECRNHHDLHIAADSVYLEVVKGGCPLPPGKEGEIVLTDLCNFGMPLIRYAINDYGTLTGNNCGCGLSYPTLRNVVGRICDNFIDSEGNVITSSSLVLHLIDDGPPVGQVQLIQESPTEILVRLSNNPHPDESVMQYYEQSLRRIIKGLKTRKISAWSIKSRPKNRGNTVLPYARRRTGKLAINLMHQMGQSAFLAVTNFFRNRLHNGINI